MKRITINKGSFQIGQRQINGGTLTIGRSKSNDVCLDDTTVSGSHAKIVTVMNTSYIQDLESTNGTMVNGQRIKQRVLKPNDVIGIGKHEILFLSNEQTQPVDEDDAADRTQLLTAATGMQSIANASRVVKKQESVAVRNGKVVNYANTYHTHESVEGEFGSSNQAAPSLIRMVVDNTSQARNLAETKSRIEPEPEEDIVSESAEQIVEQQAAPKVTVNPQTNRTISQAPKKVISDFDSVHFDNRYRSDMGQFVKTQEVSQSEMVRNIIMTEKEMGSISKIKTMYALVGLAVVVLVNVFILSFF